jgi:hypothetical protein
VCVSAQTSAFVWVGLSPFAWIYQPLYAQIGPRLCGRIACSLTYRMISSLIALISSPFQISLRVVLHI